MTTLREREVETKVGFELPPMLPEPTRILTEARQYLASRGHWTTGTMFLGTRSCALGGIARAIGYGNNKQEVQFSCDANLAIAFLAYAIRIHFPGYESLDSESIVINFNDDSKTKERVIKAFDKAIELSLE